MQQADRIDFALQESARLNDYINAMPSECWNHSTACALWDVRDLIAHLILGTRYQQTMVTRGLSGDSSPPEGFPPAGSVNAETFSPTIHQNTLNVRDALAGEVLDEFNVVNERFDALLRDLSRADIDMPCYDLRGPATVGDFIDLRVMELVVHGWDMRSHLEPEAHLPPESFPSLADVIVRSLSWLFWPGPAQESGSRYRFEVDGMQPSQWDVVVAGDQARIIQDGNGAPATTITCDGETFFLFMFGRLDVADALASGRFETDADAVLMDRLDQWFKGF